MFQSTCGGWCKYASWWECRFACCSASLWGSFTGSFRRLLYLIGAGGRADCCYWRCSLFFFVTLSHSLVRFVFLPRRTSPTHTPTHPHTHTAFVYSVQTSPSSCNSTIYVLRRLVWRVNFPGIAVLFLFTGIAMFTSHSVSFIGLVLHLISRCDTKTGFTPRFLSHFNCFSSSFLRVHQQRPVTLISQ